MTDHSDLVARLRTTWPLEGVGPITREQRERIHEAAALIETQAAEMERLRGAHTEVIKTVAYYGMMGRLHGLEHLREGLNKIGEIACRAEQPATAIASGAYRGEAG